MNQNNENDYIIAIDFGTTNSCGAMFINNNLEIIPDQSKGKRIIPSVVSYMEDNEVLVGELAVGKQIEYSQSTIFESKRFIGHKFTDDEVKFDLDNKRFYVKIKEDKNTKMAIYEANKPKKAKAAKVGASNDDKQEKVENSEA